MEADCALACPTAILASKLLSPSVIKHPRPFIVIIKKTSIIFEICQVIDLIADSRAKFNMRNIYCGYSCS